MVESQDSQSVASGQPEGALSADALYRRGMEHYRRHEWRAARESFRGLKQVDPAGHGIDALLDELEIFIRLESLAANEAPAEPPNATPAGTPAAQPLARGPSPPSPWLAPAMASVVILASFAYSVIGPRTGRQIAELRRDGQARYAAQQWPQAIDLYEELLLLAPSDPAVREQLAAAYYQRGDQRSAEALRLEYSGLYAEAAQEWEMAMADFRAAREVAPDHSFAPRPEPVARIDAAAERKRCADLIIKAHSLREREQWLEAIQTLQALRIEAPDYQDSQTAALLADTCRQAGLSQVARASTAAQIVEGIDLLQQALQLQPSNAAGQVDLEQAQSYLQAMVSYESGEWHAVIAALEPLVEANRGYADGHARTLLCESYVQRGTYLYNLGQLRPALAHYRAVVAMSCGQRAEAGKLVRSITRALTPTATPRPLPTWTPVPDLLLTATPPLTPTLLLVQAPTPAPDPGLGGPGQAQ